MKLWRLARTKRLRRFGVSVRRSPSKWTILKRQLRPRFGERTHPTCQEEGRSWTQQKFAPVRYVRNAILTRNNAMLSFNKNEDKSADEFDLIMKEFEPAFCDTDQRKAIAKAVEPPTQRTALLRRTRQRHLPWQRRHLP